MKKQHILHVGHPRCASTWLWHNLKAHPSMVELDYEKENYILQQADDMHDYVDFYSRFDHSANYNPNVWMIDQNLISFLSPHLSHVTCIWRNPYDFIERYYDFVGGDLPHNHFVDWALEFRIIDYHVIWQRWHDNLHPKSKMKVFLFEDLTKDPEEFLKEYFTFCDLSVTLDKNFLRPRAVSRKNTRTTIDFTDYHATINQKIERLMSTLDIDLTGWLR